MTEAFLKFFGALVLVVLVVFGLGFIFAFPTKWLVNYLFTSATLNSVFGVSQFDVWHAWGLNILTGLLFSRPGYSKQQD